MAIVTGGGSGIGGPSARRRLRVAQVVLSDIELEAAHRVAEAQAQAPRRGRSET